MKSFGCIIIGIFLSILSANIYSAPKSVSLKSVYVKYNSNTLVLEFNEAVGGGCNSSTIAYSNPGAANNDENIAIALAAFIAGSKTEVQFGGGCQQPDNVNWIQYIKVRK